MNKINAIVADDAMEKQLLDMSVDDIISFLHMKMEEAGKPVMLGVQYHDVLFRFSCEPVKENIVPRGYEDV